MIKSAVRIDGLLRRQENLLQEQPGTRDLENSDKILSCYYNLPSDYSNRNMLQPSMIHPHLCTHINIAFVKIVNKTLSITENLATGFRLMSKLKELNPNLKILLSIGGSGANNGFSDMVINHASRKIFIRSAISILKEFNLDGIDLDWEFPALHGSKPFILKSRERQHFSQLLREIRVEYSRHRRIYLLSVAVAAPQIIVDVAYNVDQLELYVDYVHLMTYDFHYYSPDTPFTGLNAPLFPRQNEHYYLSTLNVNFTVNMYIAKGLNRDKIVVGIPAYGHSFYLVNKNNGGLNSPASGYGSLGSSGFVSYPTVCQFMNTNKNKIIVNNETDAKVPYMHKDREWVSYDDQYSVMEKAKYIKDNHLRGAMIYSLNSDDYHEDVGGCATLSAHAGGPRAATAASLCAV
ncbi:Chitotriosidase-1 [Eumeta japonica]|uniref:Chitotriosidase-1 n=1 Tax=Eumeta variegata TaxID=151549 RepID=A0A4C1WSP8_EUMVA|nr:Chitotriosidase-1 [Eumeta japonica]